MSKDSPYYYETEPWAVRKARERQVFDENEARKRKFGESSEEHENRLAQMKKSGQEE